MASGAPHALQAKPSHDIAGVSFITCPSHPRRFAGSRSRRKPPGECRSDGGRALPGAIGRVSLCWGSAALPLCGHSFITVQQLRQCGDGGLTCCKPALVIQQRQLVTILESWRHSDNRKLVREGIFVNRVLHLIRLVLVPGRRPVRPAFSVSAIVAPAVKLDSSSSPSLNQVFASTHRGDTIPRGT